MYFHYRLFSLVNFLYAATLDSMTSYGCNSSRPKNFNFLDMTPQYPKWRRAGNLNTTTSKHSSRPLSLAMLSLTRIKNYVFASGRGLPCKNKAFYSSKTQHGRQVTKVKGLHIGGNSNMAVQVTTSCCLITCFQLPQSKVCVQNNMASLWSILYVSYSLI